MDQTNEFLVISRWFDLRHFLNLQISLHHALNSKRLAMSNRSALPGGYRSRPQPSKGLLSRQLFNDHVYGNGEDQQKPGDDQTNFVLHALSTQRSWEPWSSARSKTALISWARNSIRPLSICGWK